MTITTGSELKAARLAAGLTAKQLASMLRLTANHVLKVENGHARLSPQLAAHAELLIDNPGLRDKIRSA